MAGIAYLMINSGEHISSRELGLGSFNVWCIGKVSQLMGLGPMETRNE